MRPPLGRDRAATTCSPRWAAGRSSATTACGAWWSTPARRASPGGACACAARRRTARCRSAPTTRWSRPPRSCAGSPRTGPPPHIGEVWRPQVRHMPLPDELQGRRCSTRRASGRRIEHAAARAGAHAATRARTPRSRRTSCTAVRRPTSSPTCVEIEVDIRTVPGTTRRRRRRAPPRGPRRARPSRRDRARCSSTTPTESPRRQSRCGTRSPTRRRSPYPGAELMPGLIVGGTDARFFRDKGAVAYGTGLFSPAGHAGDRSARASTATTSASTSSRSASPPTSGSTSPRRSAACSQQISNRHRLVAARTCESCRRRSRCCVASPSLGGDRGCGASAWRSSLGRTCVGPGWLRCSSLTGVANCRGEHRRAIAP